MRSAKEMGIATVAVFSEADRTAPLFATRIRPCASGPRQ